MARWKLVHGVLFLLCGGVAPCSAELSERIGNVLTDLPFWSHSDLAGRTIENPLSLHYEAKGVPTALTGSLPGDANEVTYFTASWEIREHDSLLSSDQAQARFGEKEEWLREGSDVSFGDFGEFSGVSASGWRGSLDINFSGDPYRGRGRVWVSSESLELWVEAQISSYPESSHGARDKTSVIEDHKAMAGHWAKEIAKTLLDAASGSAPRGGNPSRVFEDAGAASMDWEDHARWAKNQSSERIAEDLRNKIGILFQSPLVSDESCLALFVEVSVLIPEYVSDAGLFGGDAGALSADREAHWNWGSQQDRQSLRENVVWKALAALRGMGREDEIRFHADVSVALAVVARDAEEE